MSSHTESNAAMELVYNKMQDIVSKALKMQDGHPEHEKQAFSLAIELSSALGSHGQLATLILPMVLSIAAEIKDATHQRKFLRPINWRSLRHDDPRIDDHPLKEKARAYIANHTIEPATMPSLATGSSDMAYTSAAAAMVEVNPNPTAKPDHVARRFHTTPPRPSQIQSHTSSRPRSFGLVSSLTETQGKGKGKGKEAEPSTPHQPIASQNTCRKCSRSPTAPPNRAVKRRRKIQKSRVILSDTEDQDATDDQDEDEEDQDQRMEDDKLMRTAVSKAKGKQKAKGQSMLPSIVVKQKKNLPSTSKPAPGTSATSSPKRPWDCDLCLRAGVPCLPGIGKCTKRPIGACAHCHQSKLRCRPPTDTIVSPPAATTSQPEPTKKNITRSKSRARPVSSTRTRVGTQTSVVRDESVLLEMSSAGGQTDTRESSPNITDAQTPNSADDKSMAVDVDPMRRPDRSSVNIVPPADKDHIMHDMMADIDATGVGTGELDVMEESNVQVNIDSTAKVNSTVPPPVQQQELPPANFDLTGEQRLTGLEQRVLRRPLVGVCKLGWVFSTTTQDSSGDLGKTALVEMQG
ncbi:uncharacterized protein F5147DRAFT_771393 [Suillus discolor]|uniref:Uncharacterized protein n=1 Tax=Suillus discolor TaxID=1912936 RepID=A0A9P7FC74_9AGAM|nr:uncharacterized protein F5147DRAFT_771393 [Suillus discolor]KAG2112332.1 hypothetical protein F5147DRAFT_771393 [Suillus discolor]